MPEIRVQEVALNAPALLVLNVTVPLGVVFVPVEVSVTVTVQVEGVFTVSGEEQFMLIDVVRLLTVRLKMLELVR